MREAVSHIWLCTRFLLISLHTRKTVLTFLLHQERREAQQWASRRDNDSGFELSVEAGSDAKAQVIKVGEVGRKLNIFWDSVSQLSMVTHVKAVEYGLMFFKQGTATRGIGKWWRDYANGCRVPPDTQGWWTCLSGLTATACFRWRRPGQSPRLCWVQDSYRIESCRQDVDGLCMRRWQPIRQWRPMRHWWHSSQWTLYRQMCWVLRRKLAAQPAQTARSSSSGWTLSALRRTKSIRPSSMTEAGQEVDTVDNILLFLHLSLDSNWQLPAGKEVHGESGEGGMSSASSFMTQWRGESSGSWHWWRWGTSAGRSTTSPW